MIRHPPAVPPWMEAGWADEAAAWAVAQLGPLGRQLCGAIGVVHTRIWSTVLRIPTDCGDVFLKGCGRAGAHEPALLKMLAKTSSQSMPSVLAVDVSRAWVMLADGGERLREVQARNRDVDHWRTILPLYAQLQIELTDRVAEMLALEVPDDRLSALAVRLASLLESADLLYLDQPDGLPRADYERLRKLSAQVNTLCDRLRACGIAETLHHGDLHDGNIFVALGSAGPKYTFFDWGDSCLTHPFFSLRVVEASVANTLGLSNESGEPLALCEGYYEVWRHRVGHAAVKEASALARRLAPIEGALRWHHVLASVPHELREPYRSYIPQLLQDVLASI